MLSTVSPVSTTLRARATGLIALATTAMALPMVVVSMVGAVGPDLVTDLGVDRSSLGLLTTATMTIAAVLSLVAGSYVDRIGPRRALLALFAVMVASFLLMALSPGYGFLLFAVALCGPAQALANPATNKLVAAELADVRATAIGVKQAGVQVAAVVSGVVLAPVSVLAGWRAAVWVLVPVAAFVGLLAWWVMPQTQTGPATRAASGLAGSRATRSWQLGLAPGMASLLIAQASVGVALASVTAFLPLFATERVGLPATTGGLLLAVFAVAGVVSRIAWNRLADHRGRPDLVLAIVCLLAVVAPLLIAAGAWVPGAVWVGAFWMGATATAANAVAMLLVVSDRRLGPIGAASGMASLGFFGGFAIGPPTLGAIADSGLGYGGAGVVCAA